AAGQLSYRIHPLRLPQPLLHQSPIGDVETHPSHVERRARGVAHQPAGAAEPPNLSVGENGPKLGAERAALVQGALDVPLHGVAIFLSDSLESLIESGHLL